ncbi:MAG TPA: TRAP transporter small permease [Verrucomicrobiota bacterium]|nr:TRAP transporter small permease [Verrucomicrobiota bacterium]HQL79853.1 TRAP transporter small permease [Verrucomicrobiota bacterium]
MSLPGQRGATEVPPAPPSTGRWEFLVTALRRLVRGTAWVAGLGLLIMVMVTCVDVVLRKLGHPLPGAYDLVRVAAGLTIACALPYTTAIKGHVAVEYFHHRLGRRGRKVVDTLIRLPIIAMFSLFTWQFIAYGIQLRASGEVSMTLQLPVFWVPYVMAFACAQVVLVTLWHLLHPGKPLIKP